MNKTFNTIALAAILAAILATGTTSYAHAADVPATSANGAAEITVDISGIKNAKGAIMAALFDSETGYKTNKGVRASTTNVTADTVSFSFEHLPEGEYAIKLFHDVNGDGEMNMNLFGMPTEPYAFSNNATGTMGPAKWVKAKFTVTATGTATTQAIRLN